MKTLFYLGCAIFMIFIDLPFRGWDVDYPPKKIKDNRKVTSDKFSVKYDLKK